RVDVSALVAGEGRKRHGEGMERRLRRVADVLDHRRDRSRIGAATECAAYGDVTLQVETNRFAKLRGKQLRRFVYIRHFGLNALGRPKRVWRADVHGAQVDLDKGAGQN